MNDENTVEPDVTGFGNPSLDNDPIDDTTSNQIDSLLDEAINESEGNVEQASQETANEDLVGESPVTEQVKPDVEQIAEKLQAEPQIEEKRAEIDPEIAAIEQPRNLSEKNQSNWRKLQETASSYKQQAAEAEILRQRLAEAEQRKEIPQDYEELKKFRAIFDIKNDPEFKSKYETPINNAKEGVYSILKKHGASDDLIKSIEAAGGPDKVNDRFWKQKAFENLPLTDAEKLKRNLVDVADLKEKQEAEISHAAENAEQILAQRETANKEWYFKQAEQIDNYMEEITKELPWARFVQATPDATPEQIKQVEEHNKRVGDLATKFNSALWPTTAQERANVAASAVFSHVLTEQLRTEQQQKNALMYQIKKLTEENNKLKGSSKIPRPTMNTATTNKSTNLNERIKMNSSDAIDLGLDEAGM